MVSFPAAVSQESTHAVLAQTSFVRLRNLNVAVVVAAYAASWYAWHDENFSARAVEARGVSCRQILNKISNALPNCQRSSGQ